MTKTEMNQLVSEVEPSVVAHIEKLWRNTTYSPRELFAFHIKGTNTVRHIEAIFKLAMEKA